MTDIAPGFIYRRSGQRGLDNLVRPDGGHVLALPCFIKTVLKRHQVGFRPEDQAELSRSSIQAG